MDSLDVRGLIADGKDAEADQLRFDLGQQKEVRDAIKEFGEDSAQVKKLLEVQAKERKRFTERNDAAVVDALIASTSTAGAGAAFNGVTQAQFEGSAVGRATIEQADAMVGHLATISVRASRQVELLEVIAAQGGADVQLGASLRRRTALQGSAVVA